MNYNYILYENLTTDSIKYTAVLVMLALIFLFLLVKFIGKIKKTRMKNYKIYNEMQNKKKELEEMLNISKEK